MTIILHERIISAIKGNSYKDIDGVNNNSNVIIMTIVIIIIIITIIIIIIIIIIKMIKLNCNKDEVIEIRKQ